MKFIDILKRLPQFKGKFRLARFLFSSYLKEAVDIEIEGKFGITYKVPNIQESIGFELFVNGVYELAYINLILKGIPQNGVLLDLGANIGSISIPIAKLRPDIKIIAVEASPRVFEYLDNNVKRNKCTNIYPINKALSTVDNQIVPFYSPTELFGKGSLSPVFTDIPENVKTITLDKLVSEYKLPKVDFIKIDVEGFEFQVLSSGLQLLSGKLSPKILFEFSGWMESQVNGSKAGNCQHFLQNLGYQLYDVTNPKKTVIMPEIAKEGAMMILAINN